MELEQIKKLIEKYALQNAIKYNKAPNVGAVMGKVMGKHPELRSKAKEIVPLVQSVLQEKHLGIDSREWKRKLEEIDPSLIEELSKTKEAKRGLPDLDGVGINEKVVMRFAPNPNGPPTLGSARGIIINHEYAKKYNGTFILRFDDTDPLTKRPILKAYSWYLEDCKWLRSEPDKVYIASERIPIYYEYAEKLIELNKAYVCFCKKEDFKTYKDAKKPCPHRNQSVEENMEYWKNMLKGVYEEGEAVLRIKTDIEHKDPALRDWGAFRIIKSVPHPRVGDKYIVYPLLDFESAIEDHLLGITHIIRGKELMDSERRQKYIYEYFGWKYPKTIHWGRMKIHEFGKLSTSALSRDIDSGKYSGWDDPRLPTLRALKKRGIQADAIKKFMIELGVTETDISLSLKNMYAENKKIIDKEANRYFFVWNPILMPIKNAKPTIAKPPIHPDKKEYREIKVDKKAVYVCKEDIDKLKIGDKIRLKDLYNIEIISKDPLQGKYIGRDLDIVKKEKMPIIHWCPMEYLEVVVLGPDGNYDGIGEKGIAYAVDKVVQFERFGFVRVDSVAEDKVIAYFGHK
ncbi:MAG: glutamate--tRNA ligase [Methanosarcinales archaeon]